MTSSIMSGKLLILLTSSVDIPYIFISCNVPAYTIIRDSGKFSAAYKISSSNNVNSWIYSLMKSSIFEFYNLNIGYLDNKLVIFSLNIFFNLIPFLMFSSNFGLSNYNLVKSSFLIDFTQQNSSAITSANLFDCKNKATSPNYAGSFEINSKF